MVFVKFLIRLGNFPLFLFYFYYYLYLSIALTQCLFCFESLKSEKPNFRKKFIGAVSKLLKENVIFELFIFKYCGKLLRI